jgi:ComF family protein
LAELSAAPVCSSCWNQLHPQSSALCPRCGENLGTESNLSASLCRICRLAEPPFTLAVAWGLYQDHLRALIQLLKYDRIEPVAVPLGALLAARVLAIPDLPSSLLVVPVPLHRSRRRTRGFNQSELLASALARSLRRSRPQIRLQLAPGALSRCRATESQAGLTPRQRRDNLRGAFIVSGKQAQSQIKGRHILLVDDIYTTGATARACSKALIRAGAATVHVATVARAQRYDAPHAPLSASAEIFTAPAIAAELPMHEDVAFWGSTTTLNH